MTENEKIARVLSDASKTLLQVTAERDKLAAENQELSGKLAYVGTRLTCEKLAAEMHEKGLNSDQEFTSLVDNLEKAASEGRLPAIQEAVRMTAPNIKLAFLQNDETTTGSGLSDLERYLVGNVG